MELEHKDLPAYIDKLAIEHGSSIPTLAKALGLPRQTLYNLRSGNWPTSDVAAKLGLTILFRTPKKPSPKPTKSR